MLLLTKMIIFWCVYIVHKINVLFSEFVIVDFFLAFNDNIYNGVSNSSLPTSYFPSGKSRMGDQEQEEHK